MITFKVIKSAWYEQKTWYIFWLSDHTRLSTENHKGGSEEIGLQRNLIFCCLLPILHSPFDRWQTSGQTWPKSGRWWATFNQFDPCLLLFAPAPPEYPAGPLQHIFVIFFAEILLQRSILRANMAAMALRLQPIDDNAAICAIFVPVIGDSLLKIKTLL